jgi:hypothetical protein
VIQGEAAVVAGPPVERVTATAYTIPTDRPESDGTYAWDSTTMVLVEIEAGEETGIGWTYGPAAVGRGRVIETGHPAQSGTGDAWASHWEGVPAARKGNESEREL